MKLLVLSPILPDKPSDGDKLRLHGFLRELSRRHEVTLACFVPDSGAEMPQGLVSRLHVVTMPPLRPWMNAGLRFFSGRPSNVNAYASSTMAKLVDALAPRHDALFCYRLRMAPYALRFRGPRVIDYTDSLTRYFERRAAQAQGLKRMLWKREAEKIAGYEQWTAEQFDAGLMNSRGDAQTLQAMAPKAKLLVASNGVDFSHLKPGKARRDPDQMIFVGNLAYPPNAEAVLWFANEILPLIRAKRPKARLVVVGTNAPSRVAALKNRPGLEFAGFAEDFRPLLWGSAVSVCPVRLAAGRQNKILDAFATGTPVVATSLTAAGVEAEAGKQLLAADEAPGFAAACLKLMQSPALGKRLAAKALGFVRARYDWSRSAGVIESALRMP